MIPITKKYLLLTAIAIVVLFFFIKHDSFSHRESDINAIVVEAYGDNCSTHFSKKNHVLMITDPQKIRQYSSLLLNNPQETDPCGDYAYNIKFWIDSELYEEILTDEFGGYFFFFPDSIKNLLDEISQQYQADTELEFNKYLLKIPVNHEPTELITQLKKNNINVFIERNLDWRYPAIKIQSKYEGEDNKKTEQLAIETAESRLNDFLTSSDIVLIHKNKFNYYSFRYYQKRAYIASYNWLYFPLNTDLSTITPQLIQASFSILEQNNPDYYDLTLIDKREADEINQFIEPLCKGCLVQTYYH